jgi:hypothetical protein
MSVSAPRIFPRNDLACSRFGELADSRPSLVGVRCEKAVKFLGAWAPLATPFRDLGAFPGGETLKHEGHDGAIVDLIEARLSDLVNNELDVSCDQISRRIFHNVTGVSPPSDQPRLPFFGWLREHCFALRIVRYFTLPEFLWAS